MAKTKILFIALVIFLTGLVGTKNAYACYTDAECPAQYICVMGACQIDPSAVKDPYNTNTTTHYTSPSQSSCESNGYTCLSASEFAQVNAESVTAYGCPSGSQCYKNISPKENSVSTTPNPAVSNPATSAVPAKNPATSAMPAQNPATSAMPATIAKVVIPTPAETGLSGIGIKDLLSNLLRWLLEIVGIIGLGGFVISGIQYIIATGEDAKMETAKKNMLYSIMGMVVALASLVIVQAIDFALRGYGTF